MKIYKVKGGALQFTMFIITVIALLLMGFVLFIHISHHFCNQNSALKETLKSLDRAIILSLNGNQDVNDTLVILDKDRPNLSIKTVRKPWGLFNIVIAISEQHNFKFRKMALLGGKRDTENYPALVMNDNHNPLVLVGGTKIEGNAQLPTRGVRTGNISGVSYYNKSLIYGNIVSTKGIPELINKPKNVHGELVKSSLEFNNDRYIDILKSNTHSNSFIEPTQLLYNVEDIELGRDSIMGNIIVRSETEIIVGPETMLEDVILIAPKIRFLSGFEGVCQAFAQESIIIEPNVKLKYPTVLSVYQDHEDDIKNTDLSAEIDISINANIEIGRNSVVSGTVLFNGGTKVRNHSPQILIKEQATIIGEVYCNQNLELRGEVRGSVYTNNFIAQQGGSVYRNHIYNGNILSHDLAPQYVGLNFGNIEEGIAKWLY